MAQVGTHESQTVTHMARPVTHMAYPVTKKIIIIIYATPLLFLGGVVPFGTGEVDSWLAVQHESTSPAVKNLRRGGWCAGIPS